MTSYQWCGSQPLRDPLPPKPLWEDEMFKEIAYQPCPADTQRPVYLSRHRGRTLLKQSSGNEDGGVGAEGEG